MPINNVWAENAHVQEGQEVPLPSGQVVLARKLGMEQALLTGMVSAKGDSLTAYVQAKYLDKQDGKDTGHKVSKEEEAKQEARLIEDLMANPETMRGLVFWVDRSVPHIVIEPVIRCHIQDTDTGPQMIPQDKREKGVLYTDRVPFEDKMVVFTWALSGVVNDPNSFREGPTPTVDGVEHVKNVERPTQQPARRRRPRRR